LAEIAIPELTLDQITELCEGAEQAARTYILSKISINRIATLDILIDAEVGIHLTLKVEVIVVLSSLMKDFDVEKLTNESTLNAFNYVEKHLR
jgi:hypothetical protein